MNASDLIQILKIFKKEATTMKPLRFWAVYFALTASSIMYLWPTFCRAIQ